MKQSTKKLPKDANKLAYEIMRLSTEEEPEENKQQEEQSEISKYLAEIGRKGGLKGGKARASKLTPERRKEIAKKAALARWNK